jgi:AcrR family transcriptional regulator
MAKDEAVPAVAPRVRRTQRERSAAMQLRVLEATIDCLYEVGYARTTTIEVAARAGVSRGAQLHHFPTKDRLVTMAVRHLLAKRLEEFRRAFVALPPDADKTSAVIDLIWANTSSRAFYAWLELVVASRTDAALRKTVLEIQQQWWDEVQTTFREFFVPHQEHERRFEVAPAFAFATLYGLALDKIVWPEADPRLERVLAALKALSGWSVQALEKPQGSNDTP